MQKQMIMPPEILYLQNGTELHHCKGVVARIGSRKIYCSEHGVFYSLSRRGLNPIIPFVTKNWHRKPNDHSNYPRLCGYVGNPACHRLVARAWLGPKPSAEYVVDHINGVLADCRAENLEWVTIEENVRRAKVLRGLRKMGCDPRKISRKELQEVLSV